MKSSGRDLIFNGRRSSVAELVELRVVEAEVVAELVEDGLLDALHHPRAGPVVALDRPLENGDAVRLLETVVDGALRTGHPLVEPVERRLVALGIRGP